MYTNSYGTWIRVKAHECGARLCHSLIINAEKGFRPILIPVKRKLNMLRESKMAFK